MTEEYLRARAKVLREGRRQAAGAVVDAIVHADLHALYRAMEQAERHWALQDAMRACTRLPSLSVASRETFLTVWLRSGDHIRMELGHDLLLTRALRVLLPPYDGQAIRLWRGETSYNRRRRTYGLSWTSEREVARAFANGPAANTQGGSVLIGADVPADAIICAPALLGDTVGEAEYLVDRRRLKGVWVAERYPEVEMTAADDPPALGSGLD